MADFGISLGISLATSFLIALLTPRQKNKRNPNTSGPKTSYDEPNPLLIGTTRVSGWWMYATEKEFKEKDSGGKGNNSGGGEETAYASFAIAFGEPFTGQAVLEKMWWDSKLVYREDGGDLDEELDDWTWYDGSQTERDPFIEAREGKENSSVHKGLCYGVAVEQNLKPWGNNFPSIVHAQIRSGENVTLEQVLIRVCSDRGVTNIDASGVADLPIRGTIQERSGESVRDFIEDLQPLHQFLAYEHRGKIFFVKQEQPLVASLSLGDLAARETDQEIVDEYVQRRARTSELPARVEISYKNPDNDYLEGAQASKPFPTDSENIYRHDTNSTLTDDEAATMCERMRRQFWLQRRSFESISLLPTYSWLRPGHVIQIPVGDSSTLIQIRQLELGGNLLTRIGTEEGKGAVLYDASSFSASYAPNGGSWEYNKPTQPSPPGQATVRILDVPLKQDSDTEIGIYASVEAPSGWGSGAIYTRRASGGDWQFAASVPRIGTYGVCTNSDLVNIALPSAYDGSDIVDNATTFNISLSRGELTNATDAAYQAKENLLLIGDEYIAFKFANLQPDGSYEIPPPTIRGCRGTEWAIGSHAQNEPAVLMRGDRAAVVRLPAEVGLIGEQFVFKAVSERQKLDDALNETTHTFTARSLFPYAPVSIEGREDPNGDLQISIVPRFRGAGLRVGETSENYELDILNSTGTGLGTVVRTLTSTTGIFIYRLSDRTADGLAGVSFDAIVYKISSEVGRGFPGQASPLPISSPLDTPANTGEAKGDVILHSKAGTGPLLDSSFNEVQNFTPSDYFLMQGGKRAKAKPGIITLTASDSPYLVLLESDRATINCDTGGGLIQLDFTDPALLQNISYIRFINSGAGLVQLLGVSCYTEFFAFREGGVVYPSANGLYCDAGARGGVLVLPDQYKTPKSFDDLPFSAPQSGDEILIQRGQEAYRSSLDNLAGSNSKWKEIYSSPYTSIEPGDRLLAHVDVNFIPPETSSVGDEVTIFPKTGGSTFSRNGVPYKLIINVHNRFGYFPTLGGWEPLFFSREQAGESPIRYFGGSLLETQVELLSPRYPIQEQVQEIIIISEEDIWLPS